MTAQAELLPAAEIERAAWFAARPWLPHPHFDDLLQEARIGAWKGSRQWRVGGGASAFTMAVDWGRFAVQRYLRRSARIIHVPGYLSLDGTPYVTCSLDDPDSEAGRLATANLDAPDDLDRIALHQGLAQIPPRSREVLQHLCLDGESQSAYARTVGLSQMGVAHRRNKALAQLRRVMR